MLYEEANVLADEIRDEVRRLRALRGLVQYDQIAGYRSGSAQQTHDRPPAWCITLLVQDDTRLPALLHTRAEWVRFKAELLSRWLESNC